MRDFLLAGVELCAPFLDFSRQFPEELAASSESGDGHAGWVCRTASTCGCWWERAPLEKLWEWHQPRVLFGLCLHAAPICCHIGRFGHEGLIIAWWMRLWRTRGGRTILYWRWLIWQLLNSLSRTRLFTRYRKVNGIVHGLFGFVKRWFNECCLKYYRHLLPPFPPASQKSALAKFQA